MARPLNILSGLRLFTPKNPILAKGASDIRVRLVVLLVCLGSAFGAGLWYAVSSLAFAMFFFGLEIIIANISVAKPLRPRAFTDTLVIRGFNANPRLHAPKSLLKSEATIIRGIGPLLRKVSSPVSVSMNVLGVAGTLTILTLRIFHGIGSI